MASWRGIVQVQIMPSEEVEWKVAVRVEAVWVEADVAVGLLADAVADVVADTVGSVRLTPATL